MNKSKKSNIYDILSVSLLVLITVFSLMRFNYLPQFIDAYYHLSCAHGFIKSGGWTSIDWWDFSPAGRPHLYPPFYHFILVCLISLGIDGLTVLRITEIAILPLFFFTLWYIFRKDISPFFSFFLLVISSSFFSFYSSVTSNIPASLAIIFGILSWHFLKRKKIISSMLFLSLSFYTHAGIPWIFVISLLVVCLLNNIERKNPLLVAFGAVSLASPFIIHELKYISYVNLTILREVKFVHYSIIILLLGIIALVYFRKRRDFFNLVFLGYTVGGLIVFFKYPYRFFSAQGILGLCMLIAYFWDSVINKFSFNKRLLIVISMVVSFFFFHPTLDLNNGKVRYSLFNSTYYNFASGKFIDMFEFNTLFSPQFYNPLIEAVKRYTQPNDIVSSNIPAFSQIIAAFSNRPTSSSIMVEVKSFRKVSTYRFAKAIVWVKPDFSKLRYWIKKLNLVVAYENNIGVVLLNPACDRKQYPLKANVSFKMISLYAVFFLFIFIVDNVKILTKRSL